MEKDGLSVKFARKTLLRIRNFESTTNLMRDKGFSFVNYVTGNLPLRSTCKTTERHMNWSKVFCLKQVFFNCLNLFLSAEGNIFKCGVCAISFSTSSGLEKHKAASHGKTLVSNWFTQDCKVKATHINLLIINELYLLGYWVGCKM